MACYLHLAGAEEVVEVVAGEAVGEAGGAGSVVWTAVVDVAVAVVVVVGIVEVDVVVADGKVEEVVVAVDMEGAEVVAGTNDLVVMTIVLMVSDLAPTT